MFFLHLTKKFVALLSAQIVDRLSARHMFGQARHVDKTWKDAVDIVAPPTSCRRQVAASMFKKPAVPSAYSSQSPAGSQSPQPTQPPAATQPPAVSDPPAAETLFETAERVLPSVEWFRTKKFDICEGEHIMSRLEAAVRFLGRFAQRLEAQVQEVGRGDDVAVGGGGGAVRAMCEGLKAQLAMFRRLCEERKLLPAATPRAASGETSPAETSATRAFEVRASSADEAAAAAASTAATSAAAQEAENLRRTTGEHRWDGWMVFALVVALAYSEDRQFLCRWTMQALGETSGLPRSQIIELLCKMHQTLLPPGGEETTGPTDFQAASTVASEGALTGSYRLRQDLRACIKAMEGCFLR